MCGSFIPMNLSVMLKKDFIFSMAALTCLLQLRSGRVIALYLFILWLHCSRDYRAHESFYHLRSVLSFVSGSFAANLNSFHKRQFAEAKQYLRQMCENICSWVSCHFAEFFPYHSRISRATNRFLSTWYSDASIDGIFCTTPFTS